MTVQPYILPSTERHRFESKIMHRSYEINIALPSSYGQSDRDWPVLLVLDGSPFFPVATTLTRLLAASRDAAETIVVGLDPPDDIDAAERSRRRIHEFSATAEWTFESPFGRAIKEMLESLHTGPGEWLGGAPLLLDCLREEIIPFVEKRCRIKHDELGLFGHSAGGNFALYALFSGKSPFRKYICGSPATAYNDDYVLRMAEDHARNHEDLAAEIYIAAGTNEMVDGFLEAGGIVSGVARMSGTLARRKYPGLRWSSRLIEGEGHISVVPDTLSMGLRFLWPGPPR